MHQHHGQGHVRSQQAAVSWVAGRHMRALLGCWQQVHGS
jgi:hypothetical protein